MTGSDETLPHPDLKAADSAGPSSPESPIGPWPALNGLVAAMGGHKYSTGTLSSRALWSAAEEEVVHGAGMPWKPPGALLLRTGIAPSLPWKTKHLLGWEGTIDTASPRGSRVWRWEECLPYS